MQIEKKACIRIQKYIYCVSYRNTHNNEKYKKWRKSKYTGIQTHIHTHAGTHSHTHTHRHAPEGSDVDLIVLEVFKVHHLHVEGGEGVVILDGYIGIQIDR